MCILLKLHYAKFDVPCLFCSKVIEEKPFEGGGGIGSTPVGKGRVKDRYELGNPILPGLLNTLQTQGGGVFYPLLIRLFFILEA